MSIPKFHEFALTEEAIHPRIRPFYDAAKAAKPDRVRDLEYATGGFTFVSPKDKGCKVRLWWDDESKCVVMAQTYGDNIPEDDDVSIGQFVDYISESVRQSKPPEPAHLAFLGKYAAEFDDVCWWDDESHAARDTMEKGKYSRACSEKTQALAKRMATELGIPEKAAEGAIRNATLERSERHRGIVEAALATKNFPNERYRTRLTFRGKLPAKLADHAEKWKLEYGDDFIVMPGRPKDFENVEPNFMDGFTSQVRDTRVYRVDDKGDPIKESATLNEAELTLTFKGQDDWSRDVYRGSDGRRYVVVDGALHTMTGDYDEPDMPVKGVKLVFKSRGEDPVHESFGRLGIDGVHPKKGDKVGISSTLKFKSFSKLPNIWTVTEVTGGEAGLTNDDAPERGVVWVEFADLRYPKANEAHSAYWGREQLKWLSRVEELAANLNTAVLFIRGWVPSEGRFRADAAKLEAHVAGMRDDAEKLSGVVDEVGTFLEETLRGMTNYRPRG